MPARITYLTAATPAGREALQEVMASSYAAELEGTPPEWARVRLVDDVPVAYIVVDPHRQLELPRGNLRYPFICDVATREDRRGEGHFRGLMVDTFARLQQSGLPLVVTHGRHPLYRRFGFDVFTHHSGIFVMPEQVERHLGAIAEPVPEGLLAVESLRGILEGLLLISDIRAQGRQGYRLALQAAAVIARQRGLDRILIEHPPAPSYGSPYPIHPAAATALTALARACGAQVVLQGADPEAGRIPDADWIKVLDAAALVRATLPAPLDASGPLPAAAFCLDTDAGAVSFRCDGTGLAAAAGALQGLPVHRWPSAALAQLVTGYQSVDLLCTLHGAPLPSPALELLGRLYPPCWRFSRNESWVYRE